MADVLGPLGPKTIFLTRRGEALPDVEDYWAADIVLRGLCAGLGVVEHESVHIVTVFSDHFIWATNVLLRRGLAVDGEHFVQRAIRADWEFNAGVRPAWWPHDDEADRMWDVHAREDAENGRAELARMRLERYDLGPLVLNVLPPRDLTRVRGTH